MENEKSIGQRDAIFYGELGDLYYQQGDKGRAEAAYRQAVHLDPNHGPAHMNLGDLATEADDWETAISEYTQARRQLSTFCPLHINLGNAYLNLDRPAEAFRCYRQALKAMRGQDREWYRDHIVSMLIEAKKRLAEKPDGKAVPVVDMGMAAEWVAQESRLPQETVLKVLEAKEGYPQDQVPYDYVWAEAIALDTQIPLKTVTLVLQWEFEYLVHLGIAWHGPGNENDEDEEDE